MAAAAGAMMCGRRPAAGLLRVRRPRAQVYLLLPYSAPAPPPGPERLGQGHTAPAAGRLRPLPSPLREPPAREVAEPGRRERLPGRVGVKGGLSRPCSSGPRTKPGGTFIRDPEHGFFHCKRCECRGCRALPGTAAAVGVSRPGRACTRVGFL